MQTLAILALHVDQGTRSHVFQMEILKGKGVQKALGWLIVGLQWGKLLTAPPSSPVQRATIYSLIFSDGIQEDHLKSGFIQNAHVLG